MNQCEKLFAQNRPELGNTLFTVVDWWALVKQSTDKTECHSWLLRCKKLERNPTSQSSPSMVSNRVVATTRPSEVPLTMYLNSHRTPTSRYGTTRDQIHEQSHLRLQDVSESDSQLKSQAQTQNFLRVDSLKSEMCRSWTYQPKTFLAERVSEFTEPTVEGATTRLGEVLFQIDVVPVEPHLVSLAVQRGRDR